MITSYEFEEWMAAHLEMETEGEITPIQAEPPHEVVMDIFTPVFLRRQAD